MADLLKKSKSIILQRGEQSSNNKIVKETNPPLPPKDSTSAVPLFQHFSSIRNRRKSRIDLSTAIESETSASARQERGDLEKLHSLTQLRRRLVRKASTFNLHNRHRSSPVKDSDRRSGSEDLFLDVGYEAARPETAPRDFERPATASTVYSEAAENILHRSVSDTDNSVYSQVTTVPIRRHTIADLYQDKPLPELKSDPEPRPLFTRAQQELLEAQHQLYSTHTTYREKHIEPGQGVWAKMATPAATPPLPYEKLKQITVEACDTALSSTKSYDHSKTETWNTTIINTMLSQLVGETQAQTSSTAATTNGTSEKTSSSSPSWKFVVHSTIVQHRSASANSEETTTKGGRRGINSAGGAYWDNDRDGMWSFKYEAAERMGFDVIVTLVWIAVP